MIPKWEEIGVAWKQQAVHTQPGRNGAQRTVVDPAAEIIVLVNRQKFTDAYGDGPILGGINNTSWDVIAERVNRSHGKLVLQGKAAKRTVDEKRLAVLNAILGLRSTTGATRTITVVVLQLPNGERYEGTDPVEWAQLYVAAGTEMGIPFDVAKTIAISQWNSAHPEAQYNPDVDVDEDDLEGEYDLEEELEELEAE